MNGREGDVGERSAPKDVAEIFWGAADVDDSELTSSAVVRHALLSMNAFDEGRVRNS